MDEFYIRATLVKERMDSLFREAQFCTDLDRLAAIQAESDLLLRNLEAIREEQLIAALPKPKPPARTIWQRLRRAQVGA